MMPHPNPNTPSPDARAYWRFLAIVVTVIGLLTLLALRLGRGQPPEKKPERDSESAAMVAPRTSQDPPTSALRIVEPAYTVAGVLEQPSILFSIDGEERVHLPHLIEPEQSIEALIVALKLVQPYARRSKLGSSVGYFARRTAARGPANRRFLPSNPGRACAAFVDYCFKPYTRQRYSYAVNTMYPQMRKRGGRLVAARVSTRYAPYFKYYQAGDILFFHKSGGSRLGHVEIYVGKGLTAGTSTSERRVGIRRVGNRGFRWMTVIRM